MKTKLFKIIFFLIIINTLFVSSAFAAWVEPSSLNFGTYETSFTVTLTRTLHTGYYAEYGVDSKPSWVSVSPNSGMFPGETVLVVVSVSRTGLTPGQTYSGTVTFYERSASLTAYVNLSVSMRVPLPAQLSISPGSYNFGESGTSCQFLVQNTGESTLNWSASEGISWLSLSSYGGSVAPGTSQYVTATVDRGTLAPGTYNGTISFTSNGSNKNVSVSMTVPDTIPPTGTISINDEAEYTNSTSVTLTLSASDAHSGVSKMQFSNDGVVFSSEEDYATSKSWTLTVGDGTKTVYVRYKDNANNLSASISDTIILDTTPPTGTISINSGAAWTNSTSVTLTLSASDAHSGVSKMQFSNDGVVFSSEEDYATSKSWTLTGGDGTKTVYVKYKDNLGNLSASISDTIILDTTPPTGTISINNGAQYTNSTSVTLILSASDAHSGVSKMQFSNDGVVFSSEENYATSKSWTLTGGDGTKTVYVQYKNNAGDSSGPIGDTITLDTTPPTGTISINSGDGYTNSISVTLTLSASDAHSGVSKMQFSNDGVVFSAEENYVTSKSWTLTTGEGLKTVYVQYKDNAGNWSGSISDTIILDTTPPTGTISINSGAVYTNSASVTLNLSASDSGGVSKMQFSNDGVVFSSEEDYATSKSWTLTTGDGTKTVYVRYKDNASNWSVSISDTIILDTTPPTGTISINSGDESTDSTLVTLTLSATDAVSGVSKMQFSNDGVVFSSEEEYAISKSWTLTDGDGTKTVYVRYKDNAGNWSGPISDTIILDTTPDSDPPTGTISINNGAVYTNSTSVTLTLSATDAVSGVSKMQFSNDGVNWSPEEDYATSKPWTLTDGDGTKVVYVRYKDNADNWSGLTSISDTIILDTTPPTGTILINSGAVYTNSASVTLTLSASDPPAGTATGSGVSHTRFSNDGVVFSSEEDYVTSKPWTLTAVDGTKTVYVQYRDNAGNWSTPPLSISDTIILDTIPPTGAMSINNGAVYTSTTSVILTLSASDSSGVSRMQFSNDGVVFSSEEDYATSKPWTLTTGEGLKTVYVQYKDNSGKWSGPISDMIILDTIPPTGTISINEEAIYTDSTSVILTLSASDSSGVSRMQFSNDGVVFGSEGNYATNKSWTLTTGDETKTVYVKYKDNAGNWSEPVSDTIILDTTPAGPPVIWAGACDGRIVEEGDYINVDKVTFTIQGSHDYYYKWNTSESDVVTSTNTGLGGPEAVVTLTMDEETSWYLHILGWNHVIAAPTGQTTFGPITYDLQKPTVKLSVDKGKILADGEIIGVLPDTGMEAKFSKVMHTGSVKEGLKLIAVKDNLNNSINEEVSLNFAWEGSTKTVITPVSELKKNHLYSLNVTDTVTDLAGNTVASEREIIFRTIMDHTEKNVIVKKTNGKPMGTLEANALAATLEANALTVTMEANALPEDGYLIVNTDPLNYQLKVNPESINVANERSITNGWYPIEGCLWEIKVCKGNGDWMEDNFGSEVRITFPYDEDNGVVKNALIPLMEETLQAFWLNEEHSNWVRMPGSRVDRENNVVVTGAVPHFSVFGLMGSAVYDLSDAHAYPVPWKPNDGKGGTGTEQDGITFTNLSAEGVIKIYTISGELVREYDYKPADGGKWTWDVETSRGEKVFSGVYIYYIKNEKEQKTGRLIIIR